MCVLYRYHNDMTDCAVARIAGHDRWQWAGNGVAWCMLRQHAGTGVVSLQQLAVAGARWRPVWRGTADAWRCIAPSRPISIRRPVPGDASRHPIPCHGWLGGMQRGVWRHGRSVPSPASCNRRTPDQPGALHRGRALVAGSVSFRAYWSHDTLSSPVKRPPGCRVRSPFGACDESVASSQARVGACGIGRAGNFGVRRAPGNSALLTWCS